MHAYPRVRQCTIDGDSRIHITHKDPRYQILRLRGNFCPIVWIELELTQESRLPGLIVVVSQEWKFSSQQDEHNHPHSPHVHCFA